MGRSVGARWRNPPLLVAVAESAGWSGAELSEHATVHGAATHAPDIEKFKVQGDFGWKEPPNLQVLWSQEG